MYSSSVSWTEVVNKMIWLTDPPPTVLGDPSIPSSISVAINLSAHFHQLNSARFISFYRTGLSWFLCLLSHPRSGSRSHRNATMAAADVREMLDLPAEGQPRPHKKQKVVEKRPGWYWL